MQQKDINYICITLHYIIIQLHSQILIIVVIVAFTCCYDKTI